MSEAAMRVADVADAVVASYLYRVVARLPKESQPSEAWFRVTSGSSRIPLEIGETTPVVDPNFEVTVVTAKTVPGLLTVLTRASAEMDGPIRVLPSAVLSEDFSSETYEKKGWKRVPVPNLSEPELIGV
ncbi:MAG: hypothetical protein WEE53_01270 [Acidimicrobiia bacterium]